MGKLRVVTFFCIAMAMAAPAAALDLQKGMHGMQWNQPVSASDRLTKVRESGPVAYYVHSDTLYQAADELVPAVVYGFYEGRFFATYIKLGSALQFNNMKRHFSGKYGPPKATHDAAQQRTILRWKTEDVNIKLKMKSTGQDIKMAIYYVPLAGKINQVQVDDIPPALYRKPAGDAKQAGEPVPLLD